MWFWLTTGIGINDYIAITFKTWVNIYKGKTLTMTNSSSEKCTYKGNFHFILSKQYSICSLHLSIILSVIFNFNFQPYYCYFRCFKLYIYIYIFLLLLCGNIETGPSPPFSVCNLICFLFCRVLVGGNMNSAMANMSINTMRYKTAFMSIYH